MHSRTKLAPKVGIAPTSRLFQSRANLPQLFGEMVVLAGNAPASSGYQPGALLLSYGTWRKASVMLRPRRCRSCFRDRCSQLISACLPEMAARVGLAPTPPGLTGRRATLTLSGNGAAGRGLTCMIPLRRRMPDVFDHGSNLRMARRAEARRAKVGRNGRISTCPDLSGVPGRAL